MTIHDSNSDLRQPKAGGLAQGAIVAFIVGLTLGLGILFWGISSHEQVAGTNSAGSQNQTAPATTGQGNPAALEQSVPSKSTGQSKERRAIQDIPATKQSLPPMIDSNVPPAGPQNP
jgi:hypothetical protein